MGKNKLLILIVALALTAILVGAIFLLKKSDVKGVSVEKIEKERYFKLTKVFSPFNSSGYQLDIFNCDIKVCQQEFIEVGKAGNINLADFENKFVDVKFTESKVKKVNNLDCSTGSCNPVEEEVKVADIQELNETEIPKNIEEIIKGMTPS